ncbi:MAG: DUF1810 domain-containing protein [Streptococcaceae bacterium]|nr:DUF1810 domain-containing protein [Streptococcaceae bacterium]
MNLSRFVITQNQGIKWSYNRNCFSRITKWEKSSHWIWYVFPQISGLGSSSTSKNMKSNM